MRSSTLPPPCPLTAHLLSVRAMSVGASPPNPPNPTPPPLAPDPAALRAFARRADAIVGPLGAPAVPAGDRLLSQLQLSSTVRDAVVAQFLRARLGDVARAARLLEDAVAWRARPEVLRPGGRECVERPEAAFPFRLVGGVAGSVVVYGALRLMERSVMDREAFLEATVAWLESVYAEFYECIDVIVDLEDWSLWRHTSKHVYSVAAEGLALLQSYYPVRLETLLLDKLTQPSCSVDSDNMLSPLCFFLTSFPLLI